MKAIFKKFVSVNKLTLLRNFFFLILFIIFYVAVFYMLINSPA
jgi:hypothetical protein